MGHVVAQQLQGSLDNTSALDLLQTGFRSGCGPETTLVGLVDDLPLQLDTGQSYLFLLLDL